jgi:O-antigen/teichoic acid export membrane protein
LDITVINFFRGIIVSYLVQNDNDDFFFKKIVTNSLKIFLVQCISLALGFLLNYVLVKTVDLDDYGYYIYIFSFFYLLLNFCILGVDTLLIRNIPVLESNGKYGKLKGLFIFSTAVSFFGSLITASIVSKTVGLFDIETRTGINFFTLTFSSLLIFSLTAINQAYLRGLNKNILSQIGEKILKPLVMILVVIGTYFFHKTIVLKELIWISVAVSGFTLLTTYVFVGKGGIARLKNSLSSYNFSDWSNSAISFFIIGVLYVLNSRVDIFLLGTLGKNSDVGIYNIALRISEVISFGLVTINFVLAPVIAKLIEADAISQLQKLITRSAKLVLYTTLPVIIAIICFRESILSFFGPDFLKGSNTLMILCFGQFINIFFGSVGLILMMSGKQKFSIYSLAISSFFNVILSILLIPAYGMTGAAIATSSTLVLWNSIMYFFVRKKMKLRTTAFSII